MSSASKVAAWVVAASVGAVETLKDQAGLCRWNYAMRSLQQRTKNQLGSLHQSLKVSSSPSSSCSSWNGVMENTARFEETLGKVMYLSCWGPNN